MKFQLSMKCFYVFTFTSAHNKLLLPLLLLQVIENVGTDFTAVTFAEILFFDNDYFQYYMITTVSASFVL